MKKKKIVQLNKLYYPSIGGIERIVQQVSEGLADTTDMNVLVSSDSKHIIGETINNVKIIRVPSLFMLGNLPIPLGLYKNLKKIKPDADVINLHMPFPFGDLACLLIGFKGKIVVWWHSDIVRQKKLLLIYKPIMKRMLKRADTIIVATQGHIDNSEYLVPHKKKCVIIPYGVDKRIEEEADRYIMSQHDCSKEKVSFLFIGRLVYYKGCKVLLEAFKKIKNSELIIVGSGTMEEELRNMVSDSLIQQDVKFVGRIEDDEVCKYIEACDVLVLPSTAKSEAFGIVQIEAMAFGKPVINTSLPSGVPYVSIDKLTGLTVPPNDVNALAEAMQWFVDHEEERIHMGQRARDRMKNEYRMETMLERIKEVYDC